MENRVSHGSPYPAPCFLLSWESGRGPLPVREKAQLNGEGLRSTVGPCLQGPTMGASAQRSRGRVAWFGQSSARVRPSGLMLTIRATGFRPSHSSNIFSQGNPGRAAALPADGRADPGQDPERPGLFSAWVAYASPSVTSWIRSLPR